MGKTIKTRETGKNIKVHDTAVNVGDRMKNIGVKTKDTVSENINQCDNVSPEQYAADKVSEKMKSGVETATVGTEKAVKKGAEKVKEKLKDKVSQKRQNADSSNFTDEVSVENNSSQHNLPTANKKSEMPKEKTTDGTKNKSSSAKRRTDVKTKQDKTTIKEKQDISTVKEKRDIPAIKEKQKSKPKLSKQSESDIMDVKKPRQRKQSPPKTRGKQTIKKINPEKQSIKKLDNDSRRIKQAGKKTAQSAGKIKKADKTVKTAEKSAKAAKETAKKSVEAAKKAEKAARATAKATAKAIKATAKAIVEAGKAIAAATKEIGGLIAAGGVPAIVILVVICLIGAIGGTCFGIFLANDETTGTQKTMTQAISELTSEYYSNLTALKTSYTYDIIEIQGDTSIDWKDVLAVYAIKTTTGDKQLEVVTLDDEKMELLRGIMNDMNKATGVVVPRTVAETVITTDEEGRQSKSIQYVTKKVLIISVVRLNKDQIAQLYNFNDEQKAQLQELTSEEYDDLWNELIGGSGEILQASGSFVGKDIFDWPMSISGTITSHFGTRVDPINGTVKTHGGTDIAAAEGTPILSAADGTVVAATYNAGGYGFYVKIMHNATYSTLYGHCSVLLVTAGQTVKKGQIIAKVGSTGHSTGPHLHFEVIQNGVRVDALKFYVAK